MEYSVVIPVYNSAATLPELVRRIAEAPENSDDAFEVLLVNDGSRDQSWDVIRRLAEEHRCVRGLNLMRNYGQHNALLAGIRAARYNIVVTMDDDLQHPAHEIPKLLHKLSEGYDVVYGTPQVKQHGLMRVLATHLTRFVLRSAIGLETASNGSSFRAFRTRLRDAFENYQSPYVVIDVLLSWGTTNFGVVPVRHEPRRVGRSNYNLLKLAVLALDVTTGFSTWPLRLASLIGFGATLLGFGLFVFVIADYLIDRENVSLYRFVASMVAIFSGAQLFALGIIGEYLARMHFRVMARPSYAIRERTDLISEPQIVKHV